MITTIQANQSHLETIRRIALATWPDTFEGILSKEQIDYMLEWMYSIESLKNQTEKLAHQFILAKDDETFCGYASYELNVAGELKTKIHKIYILPESQGKGAGKTLMNEIETIARSYGSTDLTLNVNRGNKAIDFYERLGFIIVGQEDISIGDGFFMEDFIMKKKLD
jgi:ribosomal protein S18 acetylase RimI-like enzyme